ncbi:MAG: hypothetical protein ACI9BC_002448, partial [Crocinitomicaceae bacterium]
ALPLAAKRARQGKARQGKANKPAKHLKQSIAFK